MKKNFLKIITTTILSIAIFITAFPSSAFAYNTLPYRLTGGVGNWDAGIARYYWYNTAETGVAAQASNINTAIYNWVHTGSILVTPIYFLRTTYKPSSVTDFYGDYRVDINANAYTSFYVGSSTTPISPYSSNWDWTRIYLNWPYYNQHSESYKQGIIAHEFGHVMGLDENNWTVNSIMCQSSDGRAVTTPQYDDLKAINDKY